MSADPLPHEVRNAGDYHLARVYRTCTLMMLPFAAVAVLGVVLLIAGAPGQLGLMALGIGVPLGGIYLVAAGRASSARRGLANGPWRSVRAVGWCRPPDGCNYALYEDPNASDAEPPTWVMRLPLRREMMNGSAWLCGNEQSEGLALIGADGMFWGAGRLLDRDDAYKKWSRRAEPPGRWVQQPPKDWMPPDGE